MSELKLDDKPKTTSYFTTKSVYKLSLEDEQSKANEATTYFLETTNNVISNEYVKSMTARESRPANNKTQQTINSSDDKTSSISTRNGIPRFNMFFRELKKIKKTDPKLRNNVNFSYFS